ncbi:hypothetical protein [Deinococcus multiflagellatus]|uniref:Uncharacterized protein n=1 Tax=Deinococcus multiflagellatus TaxID=1656887 RepID=A0ABW1ZIQ9_9DEIO
MLRRWAALGLLTLSVSAGAGGGHAPLPAAAQTQAVRTLVAQTDAARGQFVVFSGSSVPCIMDAAFQVDTWTDRRGVVRRLFFSATNLLEGAAPSIWCTGTPAATPGICPKASCSGLGPPPGRSPAQGAPPAPNSSLTPQAAWCSGWNRGRSPSGTACCGRRFFRTSGPPTSSRS